MKTILIVNHHLNSRVQLSQGLREAGYRTMQAHSLQEALVKTQVFSPDVVMCGEVTPPSDPLELLMSLRLDPTPLGVPFILLARKWPSTRTLKLLHETRSGFLKMPHEQDLLEQTLSMALTPQFEARLNLRVAMCPSV